jgi:hypothetical protein
MPIMASLLSRQQLPPHIGGDEKHALWNVPFRLAAFERIYAVGVRCGMSPSTGSWPPSAAKY